MARKPKQEKKRGRGRPTDFRPEFVDEAFKQTLLGATLDGLAEYFGKSVATICEWKNKFPEFDEAIKKGRKKPDGEVAYAMHRNATGYDYVEEQAFKIKSAEFDPKTGKKITEVEEIKVVKVTRHRPADTLAGMYWLNNRNPDNWRRDKQAPEAPPPQLPLGEEYVLKTDEPVPNAPVL